jgi:predicted Zn-dependent protease with MMP-like domain
LRRRPRIDVAPERFEELVAEALAEIPEEFRRRMENVQVVVDHESPPGRLLGLYEGVPRTPTGDFRGELPSRITIFRRTICRLCRSERQVRDEVRATVIHEVGHHFGLDEDRLEELGWG